MLCGGMLAGSLGYFDTFGNMDLALTVWLSLRIMSDFYY